MRYCNVFPSRVVSRWLAGLLLALGLLPIISLAQIRTAVKWTAPAPQGPFRVGQTVTLRFSANIQSGYHIYSAIPPDPPANLPTSLELDPESKGVELVGSLQDGSPAHKAFDKVFGSELATFEGSAMFLQQVRITAPDAVIRGVLDYQTCDTARCIRSTYEFNYKLETKNDKQGAGGKEQAEGGKPVLVESNQPQPAVEKKAQEAETAVLQSSDSNAGPVTPRASAPVSGSATQAAVKQDAQQDLLWLFVQAFAFGLVALVTPCVFPIIPLTVSFFTKRASTRAAGIRGALIYAGSIVFIFVVLGLLITAVFGSAAIYQLSTDPWVNLVFFVLLLAFALSFLGWFELALPGSWSTRMDRLSERGGIIGIFFMAMTLVLVSFSCTGPLVGTLLVSTAGGSIVAPVVGMLGFSLGLALPFSLFAVFPSLLSGLPRSGGWLNQVKVVLGFLELALALKFLSNADLVWHLGLLDREIYLAAWVVIFTLLGVYLMGGFRLPHDSPAPAGGAAVPVPRLLLAIGSFWFVLYLFPGLWGAPLPGVSNFLPPVNEDIGVKPTGYVTASSGFGGGGTANPVAQLPRKHADVLAKHTPPGFHAFYDLAEAQAYARKVNKPIFIDFTGHTCVNCRHMEANVWPDAEIRRALNEDYVMLQLYVDDKTRLPQPIDLPDGTRLRYIGDQNLQFQKERYNTNAQPLYVLVDAELNNLAAPRAFDLDVAAYRQFLKDGVTAYRTRQ